MRKNSPLIAAVSGFSMLAIGSICSWYIFPGVIQSQIRANIALKDGTDAYRMWKKQPFPLKFKIYFFNVTNPDEVQQGGKAILKEVGPWVFDEWREKVDIVVDEARDTIRYVLKKTYFFNQNDSGCRDLDDIITIINAALVGTALQVELLLPSALPTVSESIPYIYPGTKDIFLRTSVRSITFEGIRLYCQDEEVEFICGAMKGAMPKTMSIAENGKDFLFSMFGHLNGTVDGPWEMGRGMKNTTRGQTYEYIDQRELDIWGDQYCNTMNGSDSTVFPTMDSTKREPRLYTFAQDLCRSLYASYERESEEFGLPAVRYTTKAESLARSAENRCFCPTKVTEEGDEYVDCPPSGTADITPCLKAPVIISYPHFYLGDKKLLKYVSGLNPKKHLHENYVNMEPRTGTPLSGRKRVQINIEVKPLEGFELLENVSRGIFPVLWIEEGVTLPDDVAEFLVSNLNKAKILDSIKWVMVITGIICMMSSFVLMMQKEKLMCFSNNATIDITSPKNNTMYGNAVPETVEMGNPSLYPQSENRNVSNQYVRRGKSNQQWDPNAWHAPLD